MVAYADLEKCGWISPDAAQTLRADNERLRKRLELPREGDAKEIERLRAAWLPMESAPQDMRPILVFVKASRKPIQEEPDTMHIVFRKRPGVYVLQDDDHFIIEPTRWMPLPDPPSDDEQGARDEA